MSGVLKTGSRASARVAKLSQPSPGCLLGFITDYRDLLLLVLGFEELGVGEWTDPIPQGLRKCCLLPRSHQFIIVLRTLLSGGSVVKITL